MKKNIITSALLALSFLLLVVGVASKAFAETAPFNTSLGFGVQNTSEVTRLQTFLGAQGFLKVQPTGNYLTLTKKAVHDFQVAQGIEPTSGFFGPLTRAAANKLLASASPATIYIQSVSTPTNGLGASAVMSNNKVIQWETVGYPTDAGVNINLIRKTSDSPIAYTLIRTLAQDTPNDGEETFIPQIGESGPDIYVEVVCSSTYQFDQECKLSNSPIKVN